ncbi:unnamed protein product [Phytomonas sp. EM1]|nr:unnamed protein product [Phytomonas sp. EM1]|eukprot:CCW64492.1 unnamed protein product [Phytomonas sp. isolate EM1]
MTQGYTDSLTLVATVTWWPAFDQISQFPLSSHQNFFSAMTNSPAPLPRDTAETSQTSSYALSRLGRSVFLTALWAYTAADGEGEAEAVTVHNPFTDKQLILKVHPHICHALRWKEQTPWRLAQEGRIRICPLPILDWVHEISCAPEPSAYMTLWSEIYEKHWNQFWEGCNNYVRQLAAQCNHGSESGGVYDAVPIDHYSLLVTGEPGCGKRALLAYFAYRLPHLIEISLEIGQVQRSVQYVVERRSLDLAEVLTRDEEEGIQIVRTALRPLPYDAKGSLKPLLLLCLYNFDLLLQSSCNSLTDLVSYELSASLDELNASQSAIVIWSTSHDPSLEVQPLHHRLAFNRIYLTRPTSDERMACLQHKVEALRASQLGNSGKLLPMLKHQQDMNESEWSELLQSLNENLASLSAPAVVAMGMAELAERLQEAASESADRGNEAETGLSAYSGLFNMDAAITKLEELAVWPLLHLKTLRAFHIPCAKGVLVCGPSGSGKTALLRALGSRLRGVRGLHVMLVNGLSLIEKEVGKSEKNIAAMFAAARAHSPTALFLDNLDGLAPPRCRESSETTTATDRTLSTLLTEMDGVGGDANCVVMLIASASSPESLDPAVRRPGRLDVHVTLGSLSLEMAVNIMVSRLSTFCAKLLKLQLRQGERATNTDEGDNGGSNYLLDDQFEAVIEQIIARRSWELFEAHTTKICTELSAAVVVAAAREVMLSVLESHSTNVPSCEETMLPVQVVVDKLAKCLEVAFVNLLSPSNAYQSRLL